MKALRSLWWSTWGLRHPVQAHEGRRYMRTAGNPYAGLFTCPRCGAHDKEARRIYLKALAHPRQDPT